MSLLFPNLTRAAVSRQNKLFSEKREKYIVLFLLFYFYLDLEHQLESQTEKEAVALKILRKLRQVFFLFTKKNVDPFS